MAFVQTGPDELAVLEGTLKPAGAPRQGLPAFLAPAFDFRTRRPWWVDATGTALEVVSRDAWRDRWGAGERATPARLAWSEPDEPRFSRAFRSLVAHLDRREMQKGVPVTVMTARMPEDEAPALFRQLLRKVPDLAPGLLAYGLYVAQRSTAREGAEFLIGATPELLFDLPNCRGLSTAAVAGTRLSASGPDCLAASPKDQVEHQAVVDDLVAQLGDWGDVRASETEVRAFGQLEHLVAEIRLMARAPLDFATVVERLHPTPALGVHPRNEIGARWLRTIDPGGERNRFGAPFGLRMPSGRGRCLVAIRNLQYRNGRLEIWAGCGVVPESRYEEEWQEVLEKMHAVRAQWGV